MRISYYDTNPSSMSILEDSTIEIENDIQLAQGNGSHLMQQ